VEGLADLLKRRGEWEQLVDLLEARIDSGNPEDRAHALRSLAQICRESMNDTNRAERYLRLAISLSPQKSDYDQLLELVGDDPQRRRDRQELVASSLALCGPWVERLTGLGRTLAGEGQRRWAWCLLSPLMSSVVSDAPLKSLVLDLRKEFEKADHLVLLSPNLHERVRPDSLSPALMEVLAELDALMPLGPRSAEQAGAARVARVDARTAIGKTFAVVAERLGLENAQLSRADEMPVTYRVLDDDVPHVLVRSDIFQLLSPNETHALFATLLEQARPGARLVSALAPPEIDRVVLALLAAVGSISDPSVDELAKAIATAAGNRLGLWRNRLDGIDRGARATLVKDVEAMARRVGLIAAGELRFAAKLAARMDDAATKMPSTGKPEDLDEFFAGTAVARALAAFAASPTCGEVFA
jgi:hypothetical protein